MEEFSILSDIERKSTVLEKLKDLLKYVKNQHYFNYAKGTYGYRKDYFHIQGLLIWLCKTVDVT